MAEYPAINGTKGLFNYTAYLPYYPTRFDVSEELTGLRKVVWNFKDGYNSLEITTELARTANSNGGLPKCKPFSEWWICIIPASTGDKTKRRFETFCNEFSKLTGFQNGYTLISNSSDRDAKHTQEDRNNVNIMESIAFNNIKGHSCTKG